ncbi:putative maltase MLT1 [Paramyrothecium foliicola]|nr:putative maltase MLT1 [Paramyrothecium foliicola]
MDTNGDGYGDLRGVTEKLEYIVDLGIDVIWLSPIFDSPMYDMGYDIADYYKINTAMGNMEDFDNLLEQAHKRGLRVILDIALNHTSNEHAWFKKSVAAHEGAANGFKDFYIWGDPIVDENGNKRPPSNWASVFEGCMWEWVPEISKYYLHVFGRTQPDLNWENAEVRKELWKVLRFWLNKGVDGFRLDAIDCISKVHNQDLCAARPGLPTVSGWPDAPISTPGKFEQKANEMFANGPKVHKYLREMHEQVFAHYDALSLGEMSCGITPEMGISYISREATKQELDLILHFEHVELDCVDGDKWVLREWELPELKASVSKWQTRMAEAGGWDTVWMENHDQPRGLSRFCSEAKVNREHAAKLLAMWLFTLQGTVIMFQGQELEMTNPEEFSEETIRDVETRIYWDAAHAATLTQSDGVHNLDTVKKAITSKSRDASRIPIPWNKEHETSAGFTNNEVKPWLPVHPHFPDICAKNQHQNPASVWSFYRDIIRLRKQHPALVYPASFNDSDGDGLGDIHGITTKLDYLSELGVDVLWLSPIYESPQEDMGYDIVGQVANTGVKHRLTVSKSNYREIHRPFGTMEDVHHLIAELKKRDMKLVMDLVVNHTSTQHAWFVDSSLSKTSMRRDWYIWREPKYDQNGNRQPPNNWAGLLDDTQSAWTYHPETNEYYLSLFSPHQADLNWENPRVRGEVHEIARFWLEKGISGFRMDVINLISKDQNFPDAEILHPNKTYQPGDKYFASGARLLEFLQELKREVLSKYDILTVGEMPFLEDEEQRLEIVKAEEGCLNMIFTFETIGLDIVPEEGRFSFKPWSVEELRKVIERSQSMSTQKGWASLFCENHDQPRSVSRWCDDSDTYRVSGSKILCMAQVTLTGTLYIYQGEELGMRNIPADWGPEEYKDVESVSYWNYVCSTYPEGSPERKRAMDLLRRKARDNARTPFQWDSTSNGGFCPPGVKPWMRVNDDYPVVNAADQVAAGKANERTALTPPYRFWQRALEIRKQNANLFIYGDFELIKDAHPSVFAFKKSCRLESDVSITVLNCSGKEAEFTVPHDYKVRSWVLGSYDALSTDKPKEGVIQLSPWEGLVGLCKLEPGTGK